MRKNREKNEQTISPQPQIKSNDLYDLIYL